MTAFLLIATLVGCGSTSTKETGPVGAESLAAVATEPVTTVPATTDAATTTATATTAPADSLASDQVVVAGAVAGSAEDEFAVFEDFASATFSNPTVIDNKWMPLSPGTRMIYEGVTVTDGKEIPHRIVVTVSDLVKRIDGVPCVVVWSREFSDGALAEVELSYLAQDDAGNVWHLGQYSEGHEDGEFVGGRAWMRGHVDGAQAGIMMPADPKLGTPSYSEGYAPPPYFWTDRAIVGATGEKVSVPAGDFIDVLVVREYSKEEPGAFQVKSYAPRVGNISIGWEGSDQTKERLDLTRRFDLDPEGLARASKRILELEERAYVYATTPPAQTRSDTVPPVEAGTGPVAAPAERKEPPKVTDAEFADFEDRASVKFDNSTVINNRWMPLIPGTQMTYEGVSDVDGELIPHQIVITVTDLVKEIDGVNCVVVWDRDISDGSLVESEITFFAQDNDGNVWQFGEYRELWEGPQFVVAQAWMPGHLKGAKAGIMMLAEPNLAQPSHSEGFAPPPYYWTDRAFVSAVGQKASVKAGDFENVLVNTEYSQTEKDSFQHKHQAPGVGNVKVTWDGKDQTRETLELVKVATLGPDEMDEVRAASLQLEEHAYTFATTPPATRR